MLVKINNTEIEVVSHNDTWAVSNEQVAHAFGVGEDAIRKQKSRGEFKNGVHFYGVTNCHTVGNGGSEKTMWTKKGVIVLGFKLRETPQTIAFRDWAADFILSGAEVAQKHTNIESAITFAKKQKITDTRQIVNLKDNILREAIYTAHGGKCFYTGKFLQKDSFDIDHIQPKANGGIDALYNLVLCDPSINRSKGAWVDADFITQKQLFNEKTHAIMAGKIYNDRIIIENLSSFSLALLSNAAMVKLLCSLLGERIMKKIMMNALGVGEEEVYALSSPEEFLKDSVKFIDNEKLALKDLYSAYAYWCKSSGSVPMYLLDFKKKIQGLVSIKKERVPKPNGGFNLIDFVYGVGL